METATPTTDGHRLELPRPTRCRVVEVVTPEGPVYAAIVTDVRDDGSIDCTAFRPAQGGTREFVCLRSAEELEANVRIDRRGREREAPVKPEETAHWRWPPGSLRRRR